MIERKSQQGRTPLAPANPLARWLQRNPKVVVRSLAEALGVSISYLGMIRGGRRVPSPDLLDALERVTGERLRVDEWRKVNSSDNRYLQALENNI